MRTCLVLLLLAVASPAFAQVEITEGDAGVVIQTPSVMNIHSYNGYTTAYTDSAASGLKFHSRTGVTGSQERWVRMMVSVEAGVHDVYVHNGFAGQISNAKAISVHLGTSSVLPGDAAATRTFGPGGVAIAAYPDDMHLTLTTTAHGTVGMSTNWAKVGSVTSSGGGYLYIVFDQNGLTGGQRINPVVIKKTSGVPKWFRYIGGDVDTQGFYDSITTANAVNAVVLPITAIANLNTSSGTASAISNYPSGNLIDETYLYNYESNGQWVVQNGVISRYVQLTFNDPRYGAAEFRTDAGQPTYAWVIELGRNGGLTARSAHTGYDSIKVFVSDWYDYSTGKRCDLQYREARRMPRFNKLGMPQGSIGHEDSPMVSVFPYDRPEYYGSPSFQSTTVGSPLAATVGWLTPTSHTVDAGIAQRYPVYAWPAGLSGSVGAPMKATPRLTYPMHLNLLKCIVAACNADPPAAESERRFVYLISRWIEACEDAYSFKEYRTEVARGANDTVIIEDEDEDAIELGEGTLASRKSGGWDGTDPMPKSPFNTEDFATSPLSADMDFNFQMAGIPTDPNLVKTIHTSIPSNYALLPASVTPWLANLEGWRAWFRLLQVAMIFTSLFYWIFSALWKEL